MLVKLYVLILLLTMACEKEKSKTNLSYKQHKVSIINHSNTKIKKATILSTNNKIIKNKTWEKLIIKASTLTKSHKDKIHIYYPPKIDKENRVILALHGWNGKSTDWAINSNITDYADKYNFIIVAINMGTSVYELNYYPETKKNKVWSSIPGTKWISLIYPLIIDRLKYVGSIGALGVSTGGEGAVLLAGKYNFISVVVAISGTFDLINIPKSTGEYRIHSYIYGDRANFKKRWQKESPVYFINGLKGLSILFIHGKADKVVSYKQSKDFFNRLTRIGGNYKLILYKGKHDWGYWNSQLNNTFKFLNESLP